MVDELPGFVAAQGFAISRGAAGGWTNFDAKQVVISDKANRRQGDTDARA
jgi:hypothetical protein